MAQVARSPKTYDVCIIGSGAGGGMAAKILTEGGLSVALLEAGPDVHPGKDFKTVSYTHLDVYKRQAPRQLRGSHQSRR